VYASKRFYDPKHNRQILTSWVNEEHDSFAFNATWSGIAGLPRTVTIDPADPHSIVTYPIVELESLRTKRNVISSLSAPPVSVAVPMFDLDANFEKVATTHAIHMGAATDETGEQPGPHGTCHSCLFPYLSNLTPPITPHPPSPTPPAPMAVSPSCDY
jgi:hypothetical protein